MVPNEKTPVGFVKRKKLHPKETLYLERKKTIYIPRNGVGRRREPAR